MDAARRLVLFVDDETAFLDGIRRSFAREPYECLFASTFDQALEALETRPIDVIVCDERFPGRSGWELLSEVKRTYPRIMRLMLTGAASLASTVATINQGHVFRFLLKPCDHDTLLRAISDAVDHQALHERLRHALACLSRVNTAVERIAARYPAEHREALAVLAVQTTTPESVDQLEREMDARIGEVSAALGNDPTAT